MRTLFASLVFTVKVAIIDAMIPKPEQIMVQLHKLYYQHLSGNASVIVAIIDPT